MLDRWLHAGRKARARQARAGWLLRRNARHQGLCIATFLLFAAASYSLYFTDAFVDEAGWKVALVKVIAPLALTLIAYFVLDGLFGWVVVSEQGLVVCKPLQGEWGIGWSQIDSLTPTENGENIVVHACGSERKITKYHDGLGTRRPE